MLASIEFGQIQGAGGVYMDIHDIVKMTPEKAADEALKIFDTDGDGLDGLT